MDHPRPLEYSKMQIFSHCGPYMKNWWLFFFLVLKILDINLNLFYQIISLFDEYIGMGERIADGPNLIIEGPPGVPPKSQKAKKADILVHLDLTMIPRTPKVKFLLCFGLCHILM